jgi:hypothetical protein
MQGGWRGGGGGVDRGFRVGHGGGPGWWVRGGFHRVVVLVDLALGLWEQHFCSQVILGVRKCSMGSQLKFPTVPVPIIK